MSSATILLLFALFGGVCGFYLSVVGFAVTALVICLLVGAVSAVAGGPFTLLLIVGAFVALQVGFFFALAGRALALHLARLRQRPSAGLAEADLRAEQDQTP